MLQCTSAEDMAKYYRYIECDNDEAVSNDTSQSTPIFRGGAMLKQHQHRENDGRI